MLTNDVRLRQPLPRKSYALPSSGEGVPIKLRGRQWMPGAPNRIDWSLVVSLTKPRFGTSNYRCTEHTDAYTHRLPWRGMRWIPRKFIPIRKAYELSNQPSVTGKLCHAQIIPLPCELCYLVKGINGPKTTFYFDLDNRTATNRRRNHESRGAGDGE